MKTASPKRIVITGGAGFIGSNLCDRLLALGHKVLVIDNYSSCLNSNLQPHENLIIKQGNVSDVGLLDTCFSEFKPEIVVHAAASFKDPESWREDAETNVVGTIAIVNACKNWGVLRLIYFQTSLCYGINVSSLPITTEHPLLVGNAAGISSYAISKTAAEQYIALSGINYVSFRLANIYGPRNITGPLPSFYTKMMKGEPIKISNTSRDFVYVDDLLDCVLLALNGKGNKGVYHISTGKDISIKQLFDALTKELGNSYSNFQEVEMGKDDTKTILIDPLQTNKDFGWHAKTNLEEGLRNTIKWYSTNKIENTYTHLRNL